MNVIKSIIPIVVLFLSLQTAVSAQNGDLSEIFKTHMNETVQDVKNSDSADEKRAILDESFNKMLEAVDKIETSATLSDEELSHLQTFQANIEEKLYQLNGRKGYERVGDLELEDFSEYSQQDMEQADRTLTLSLTTALLIVIILLLI